MTQAEEAELLKLKIVVNGTIEYLDRCNIKDIEITLALRKASIEMRKLSTEIQKQNNK
jgi:hypothetical protein